MFRRIVRGTVATGVAIAMTFAAEAASAQPTGTVTGQVTAEATGQPLAGAQIAVEALRLGTLTQRNGRFLLSAVPAGTHTLTVTIIGYATETRQITVSAGQTSVANFELPSIAINLDEIVVTGTGAPTERRRLGQTISSVSSEEMDMAPVTTVGDALQGRVPGIMGGVANRETGQASRIMLRGAASLTQRNEPLIYVDGVRLNNSTSGPAGITADQLSAINPSDIERIEVIRGAAAATLFGTEASSGVIQIFTKRGHSGEPVYTFQIDQQIIHQPSSSWPINAGYDAATGQIITDKPADVWVDLGHYQNYMASVRGGTGSANYYLSGRLMHEDHPLPNNELLNGSLRATLDIQHTDRFRSSWDATFIRGDLEGPRPSWSSIASEMLLANPVVATPERPHGEMDFTVQGSLNDKDAEVTDQVLLGASVSFDLLDDLTARGKVGYHDVKSENIRMRPEGVVLGFSGIRSVRNREVTATTVDASLAWDAELTDRLTSSLVVGGQSFWEKQEQVFAEVQDFASPTLRTLSGGSRITSVGEFFEEVINAGVFVQEQIGLDNRLFLTAGVRMDGNSAFGEDFGLETYPKAGLSWVVSEHDFFNVPRVDELRLRGAFGSSGLQPGAFDAQRTWQPESFVGGPSVEPGNLGNPDLKPERSSEIEFAVEAGMFDGRLGFEVVYFDQQTVDALLPKSPAPSTGFTSSQLVNVGKISSNGWEVSGDFRTVQRPGFSWDLNAAFTHTDQVVEDMGGVADYRIQGRRRWSWIAEGYRPGAVIAPVQDPDDPYTLSVPIEDFNDLDQISPNSLKAADGTDSLVHIGNSLPTWTVNLGSTFRIGDNVTVRALFEGAGGDYVISNETRVLRTATAQNMTVARAQQILDNPNATVEEKEWVLENYGKRYPSVISSFMEDGDYLRFAELSFIYRLPETLSSRMGLGTTRISVGGRNLKVWTGYSGMIDPGSAATGGAANSMFLQNIDYITSPSVQRYTFSLQTTM